VSVTAKEIAEWMLSELIKHDILEQESTVYYIRENFGQQFVYDNMNGNLAIGKSVLKEFRELTGDTVVWERGQRCWRKRQRHDESGRQQY
jgi:hypothetical protein